VRPLWLVALPFLLVACGTHSTPVPLSTLPTSALPHLASRDRELPAPTLAGEAFDHAAATKLLASAGYDDGREREFYGRSAPFAHVTARTLRFATPTGATRYLTWARQHAVDTTGPLRSIRALKIGDGGALVRARGCGCHGETPTYLATWRHGKFVFWLLASGPGADFERVDALATELDAAGNPA
jgi:hypothetical protein